MKLELKTKLSEYLRDVSVGDDFVRLISTIDGVISETHKIGDTKTDEMLLILKRDIDDFKLNEREIDIYKKSKEILRNFNLEWGKKAAAFIKARADSQKDKQSIRYLDEINFTYVEMFDEKVKYYNRLLNEMLKSIKEEKDWKTYMEEVEKSFYISDRIEKQFGDKVRAAKIRVISKKIKHELSNWPEYQQFLMSEISGMRSEYKSGEHIKKVIVQFEHVFQSREEFIESMASTIKNRAAKMNKRIIRQIDEEGKILADNIFAGTKILQDAEQISEIVQQKIQGWEYDEQLLKRLQSVKIRNADDLKKVRQIVLAMRDGVNQVELTAKAEKLIEDLESQKIDEKELQKVA